MTGVKFCAVEGCDRPAKTRGWCHTHYKRWQLYRDVNYVNRAQPEILRGPWSGCWEWTGRLDRDGYGRSEAGSKGQGYGLVHRLAYEAIHGDIPGGLMVCHTCDNRRCFRPDHLFVGTARDNSHDAMHKGRLPIGERHGRAKLTEAAVRELRRLHSEGHTLQSLADRYGVCLYTAAAAARRETWKHVA